MIASSLRKYQLPCVDVAVAVEPIQFYPSRPSLPPQSSYIYRNHYSIRYNQTSVIRFHSTAVKAMKDDDRGDGDLGRGADQDVHERNENLRVRQEESFSESPISEVLKFKHSLRWEEPVICRNDTIRDAINLCVTRNLSGIMVVDNEDNAERRVVGMITSRDLLRILDSGLGEGQDASNILSRAVDLDMKPIKKVVYARPDDTISTCRSVMARLGTKCVPVLSKEGRVEGVVDSKDLFDFALHVTGDRSGKGGYLKDVAGRVGMTMNTSMADPPSYVGSRLAARRKPLYASVGSAQLPHPFKTKEANAGSRRDFGPGDICTDNNLSEDAHFIFKIKHGGQDLVYTGVADGVGSWKEYGVDPRRFSNSLMKESTALLRGLSTRGPTYPPPSAVEVIQHAHTRTKAEGIVGSSTACVALFDGGMNQLHFSNLGDSGIIVLRHIDSDVAGALKRDRNTPRYDRNSDMRAVFVSQQQLHSFNHPYQLGWNGIKEAEEDEGWVDGKRDGGPLFQYPLFQEASESCTSSVHLRRGDIVLIATDGLFDNVETEDITRLAVQWENKYGFMKGGDIGREERWNRGKSMAESSAKNINLLASSLCNLAQEKSLEKGTDSPFAILAKENDIMWSGGMPDDCTVIAMHIVGKNANAEE